MKKFFLPLLILLAACSHTPDKPKPVAMVKPTIQLTLVPQDTLKVGKPTTVLAKLNNIERRYVLLDSDLEMKHTQKFHLFVVDSTMTDYQHIHPQPTATQGLYSFTFTPKLSGGYRAWADVTVGGKQEFAMSEQLDGTRAGNINKTESHEATVGGYHFTLVFDKSPMEGGESMGTITVTSKGKPVSSLEPVMGAFAHIVGFYDDFRTVLHTHPMGDEPKDDKTRGGPEIMFHLEATKPGFIKLFAQVRIGGKEMMVPFGVKVAPAAAK